MLSNVCSDTFHGREESQVMTVLMALYPPKPLSLTVVLGLSYLLGKPFLQP